MPQHSVRSPDKFSTLQQINQLSGLINCVIAFGSNYYFSCVYINSAYRLSIPWIPAGDNLSANLIIHIV